MCQASYKGKARFSHRTTANPNFPIRSHTYCTICDKSLTGSSSTGRKGKNHPYYHHQKQGCVNAKFIPKTILEQLFVEYLNEITPDTQYEKTFKAVMVDIWKENYKKHDEESRRVRVELEKLEAERLKVFDLRKEEVFNDDEFLEQKNLINGRIYEKRKYLQENHVEEFNMEQSLDYCFKFVRNTSEAWLRLGKKNFSLQQRFQKQVFPKKLTFDGKKFGTTELSRVYKLNQDYKGKTSNLVLPTGFEPVFLE